ncbi:MAG TPA: prepilin-type N-terminal cleavage/methylation domain-containing protein [Fimbriimonadaceae bacterium]|jgi:prepilin-type N-terminal cleavage/methylation domain-containing protein
MTKTRKTGNYAGFTLIEMLVVIAIIAILAGILFPVFAKAKAAAKKAACMSNTKQLGLGYMMYAGDYDDSGCLLEYPQRDPTDPNDLYTVFYWDYSAKFDLVAQSVNIDYSGGLLQPYIKNGQVFGCPMAPPNPKPTSQMVNIYYPGGYSDNRSLGLGLNEADAVYPNGSGAPVGLTTFSDPAETVLLGTART